jgi:alkylhydroperoxidase/carboxymuconolactone decarboxylase family protein YurZ
LAKQSLPDADARWRRRHDAFFRREGLARRTRHGAALSALTAAGDWKAFSLQTKWALADRCSLRWLREVTLQNYLFVGYPRAIHALQTLSHCAQGRDVKRYLLEPTRSRDWLRRGRELCRQIYGEQYEALLVVMRRTHPELADWMIREGYGKVLARPFLGPRVRERSHAAGALHVGAKRAEAREAVETGLRMAPAADKTEARSVLERALC